LTKQLTFQDYLSVARRRKWLLIVPPIVCTLAGFAACFFLKPKYTSTTLVLVEGPRVATTLVKPAVTEDLNERLLAMEQQILSRSRLEPVMQRFGLYKDELNKTSTEDLIDRMRANVQVDVIHGVKEGSTPGFNISFTAANPKMAQDICAEITSLFMQENLKEREESAVGTTDFLASQLADSKRSLDEQDAKLADFERKHMGQLPGEQNLNMDMLNSLRSQLDSVTQSLYGAQQDRLYIENLLNQETAATQDSLPTTQVESQIKLLREKLIDLEAHYTPQHPDVLKTKQMIATLEKSLQDNASTDKKASPAPKMVNEEGLASPNIQHLRDGLHVLQTTLREKSTEQARLQQAIKQYESRLELSPSVKEEYKKLTRDYQTAQNLYADLLKKKSESEMSTDLERRQQGEQFRVVDLASLPDKPSFPNKLQFAGGGFAVGLCLGIGLALLMELSQKAIRGESDIEFYLRLPVIVGIPVIVPDKAAMNSQRRRGLLRRRHRQLANVGKAVAEGH
jgi:polysaccharide chain length determinant protein (PEP-CTERM system associated)